ALGQDVRDRGQPLVLQLGRQLGGRLGQVGDQLVRLQHPEAVARRQSRGERPETDQGGQRDEQEDEQLDRDRTATCGGHATSGGMCRRLADYTPTREKV